MNFRERRKNNHGIRGLFSKWFYWSIIFILIGLVISTAQSSHPTHSYIISVLSKLFESTGIAIFIANSEKRKKDK